jgi:hypothetical protein
MNEYFFSVIDLPLARSAVVAVLHGRGANKDTSQCRAGEGAGGLREVDAELVTAAGGFMLGSGARHLVPWRHRGSQRHPHDMVFNAHYFWLIDFLAARVLNCV